jgi:hypothetical protein
MINSAKNHTRVIVNPYIDANALTKHIAAFALQVGEEAAILAEILTEIFHDFGASTFAARSYTVNNVSVHATHQHKLQPKIRILGKGIIVVQGYLHGQLGGWVCLISHCSTGGLGLM